MKLAVIGGTGRTAIPVIKRALDDHKVYALVRTPSKFPSDLKAHPNLTLVKGDIYDSKALSELLIDAELVLVATAAPPLDPTTIVQDSVQAVIKHSTPSLKHVYLISSNGVGADTSQRPFFYRVVLHPFLLHNNYQDLAVAEQKLKEFCTNGTKFTIFHPVQIWNTDPTFDVVVYEQTYGAPLAEYSNQITYEDLARIVYQEIKEHKFSNKTVVVNSTLRLGSFTDPRTEARGVLILAMKRYIPRLILGLGLAGFGIGYLFKRFLKN
ncbi:hypothetical protein HK103_001339 [Boothiomyces macroporosus]|uniref:NAD(P)-binding domain-containing protein n=1 Tax=Boothiomyces macroporosus TaxID=261099 RepID=A0AAD5UAY7_9FUNG|nr:hypothetical protein HK103_001339 [Boothiomyces macroporosus]